MALIPGAVANASAYGVASSSVEQYRYLDPAWSPDGKRIAFVAARRRPPTYGALFVMNADGSGVKRLMRGDSLSTRWPTWSPDSKEIAFFFYPANSSSPRIHVMRADGRGLRQVARGSYPDWSPGGRKIAFNGSTLDADVGDIVVMNPDGRQKTVVATSNGETAYVWPTWSPDGERLAFVVVDAPDTGGGTTPHLVYVSDYSTRRVRRLSKAATLEPDWSPDGHRIAYAFAPEDGERTVRLLDLRTQQTTFLHRGSHPRWSPDGRQIVFTDGGQIHVMNADGSNVRQLTR